MCWVFLNKDRFFDKQTHVAFYTKYRPEIYNNQTIPGVVVCWSPGHLAEGKLGILPMLIACQDSINVTNIKLFNMMKIKLNAIIARMPEEEKIMHNKYIKDSISQYLPQANH
jgi:hypothetical protein